MTFTMDAGVAAVLEARTGKERLAADAADRRRADPPRKPALRARAQPCRRPVELHLHPGVPHEYDAIAFDADVSRRAQRTAAACCGALRLSRNVVDAGPVRFLVSHLDTSSGRAGFGRAGFVRGVCSR